MVAPTSRALRALPRLFDQSPLGADAQAQRNHRSLGDLGAVAGMGLACRPLNNVPHDTQRTRASAARFDWSLPPGGREHEMHALVRPHALHGLVRLPERTGAIIVIASSLPVELDDRPLAKIGRSLIEAGFGVALFEDLLPRRLEKADPLTVFDTQLLASSLAVVADLLGGDQRFARFRFGALGHGSAGTAAIIAAAEQPRFWNALVLYDAPLVPASTQLPQLIAPSLLLQSRAVDQENAFLVSRGSDAIRQLRILTGSAAVRWRAVADESRRWFGRHLVGEPS
jgi:putative phosphoribosyl transferase